MRKRYSCEDLKILAEMASRGVHCDEIATYFGVTTSSIHHALSRYKIKFCKNPLSYIEGEVWRDLGGFTDVLISNMGRFLRVSTKSLIIPYRITQDYTAIDIGLRKTMSAHRLVAEAFIPNPDSLPEVNHINGVKDDNRVENLEWVTPSENVRHSIATGLRVTKRGLQNPKSFFNEENIQECVNLREQGHTYESISKMFGTSRHVVSRSIKNYRRSTERSETIETAP